MYVQSYTILMITFSLLNDLHRLCTNLVETPTVLTISLLVFFACPFLFSFYSTSVTSVFSIP